MNNTYLRNLVVGVDTKVPLNNGKCVTAVNFDNAATTPPFYTVLKEVINFSPWYSSVHRGQGYKSRLCTRIYENGREIIKNFVNNYDDRDITIYTKNCTESINMLAYILSQNTKKSVIISTFMEHNANIMPWQKYFKVEYVQVDDKGRLILEDLENKLKKHKGNVRLVTASGASNVTGYMTPIHKIAKLAHKYNTKLLVDGAQLVPHAPIDMKPYDSPEHIDYLAFSAHKMYAPFGIGILIGPKKSFKKPIPFLTGGGCARVITHNAVQWHDPPLKDEAGTPDLIGISALIAAIKTLNYVGMEVIHAHEFKLFKYALEKLKNIPDIKLYGNTDFGCPCIGTIPFNIKGLYHSTVSKILSFEAGIAVRDGLFCAHPYVEKLLSLNEKDMEYYFKNPNEPLPGMVRISFGLYNTYGEIDRLIDMLYKIVENKERYKNKYNSLNN